MDESDMIIKILKKSKRFKYCSWIKYVLYNNSKLKMILIIIIILKIAY